MVCDAPTRWLDGASRPRSGHGHGGAADTCTTRCRKLLHESDSASSQTRDRRTSLVVWMRDWYEIQRIFFAYLSEKWMFTFCCFTMCSQFALFTLPNIILIFYLIGMIFLFVIFLENKGKSKKLKIKREIKKIKNNLSYILLK